MKGGKKKSLRRGSVLVLQDQQGLPKTVKMLESGAGILTVLQLLGHSDVWATVIHRHVLNRPGSVVRSPADGKR